jgi:transposase
MERLASKVPTVSNVSSALHELGEGGTVGEDAAHTRRRFARQREGRSYRGLYRRNSLWRKKRGLAVNCTRGGKTTKIMAVVDRNGLPIAAGIAGGAIHETRLVKETLAARFTSALPQILIGDKAYDSDPLDLALGLQGVEMISPNRSTRSIKTQDGRKLRRYKRRWKVERFFAWLKRFRRLTTRWEWRAQNFLSFLELGCLQVLLRRL